MRKLGVGVLSVLALIGLLAVIAIVGIFVYASTEYTECYGIFDSRGAAERAADAAKDQGLNADITHRASESAVRFASGETGDDAREARQTFRQVVGEERGTLGHPDGGCVERTPLN